MPMPHSHLGVYVYPPTTTSNQDTFANVNAYTVVGGSVPTVVSNVMTVPNGTTLTFGSPSWGAINLWQMRFQFVTGLAATFYIHRTDASNYLDAFVNGTSIFLSQVVAGTTHNLANATIALTNGNFYWLQVTQFPTVPGDTPYVQATLYNDSAGAIGTAVASGGLGPVQTFDAVTALTGRSGVFANGAALAIGGNFSNVHTLSLFGPGGWPMIQNFGTGLVSGGWDGTRGELGMSGTATAGTQTYPNGPVTSYGALRMDYPPAGTGSATWAPYTGGAPGGTFAMPVAAAGNALGVSGWVKSSGLHATNGSSSLVVSEYNSGGTFLRNGSVQTLLGSATNAAWTQVSGTYTTGANCAYVAVACETHDTAIAGESASATVWFDNIQVWNQTTTGQTTMPYCELRFPQSPAQLMVSGLVGDVPAPATLAFATYIGPSLTSPFTFLIGRRAYATSGTQFVAPLSDNYNTATFKPVLDSASYGGFYMGFTLPNSTAGYQPFIFQGKPADYQGFWALLLRLYSAETAGTNIGKVTTLATSTTQNVPWEQYALGGGGLSYDEYITSAVAGLTTQNTWTPVNAGVFPMPSSARSAATDLTLNFQLVGMNVFDSNATPAATRVNWAMLLPNDGYTVRGQIQFAGTMSTTIFNGWSWYYIDASQSSQSNIGGIVPITAFSFETTALANLTHAAGGSGLPPSSVSLSGAVSIIPTGNAYLTLDPHPPTNALSVGGVNQLAAVITDPAGTVFNFAATISYTPCYLDPR